MRPLLLYYYYCIIIIIIIIIIIFIFIVIGLDVDGRTILECFLKKYVSIQGVYFDSTKDRDYWRALVNVALNLRVS